MRPRFVPATAIYYLDLVARRRRHNDGTYDPHIPRMRVMERGQVVRDGRSVVSMAVSAAPRHLSAESDAYALHGMTAYNGPVVSGSRQPRGQAVLQIWPRVQQDQARTA